MIECANFYGIPELIENAEKNYLQDIGEEISMETILQHYLIVNECNCYAIRAKYHSVLLKGIK